LIPRCSNVPGSSISSVSDKTWGLTDAVSFVVMQEQNLVDALTTDEHFHQAGFRALLRESVKP